MDDELEWRIARERWALRVLARHQESRQQIEAANRHCLALGRLMKEQEQRTAGATPRAPAAQVKTAWPDHTMSSC